MLSCHFHLVKIDSVSSDSHRFCCLVIMTAIASRSVRWNAFSREHCHALQFTRTIRLHIRVDNLAYVSLEDAMHHIEAWRVDWDMNLSRAEVALVFDDVWRAGLRF